MDRSIQLVLQERHHRPMTRHAALVGKGRRYQHDLKMGFPFGPRARMACMLMTFVHNDNFGTGEPGGELAFNGLLY